jgi:hypothetical protein
MSTDFRDVQLFAWIGEDELGSGEIGLKQAIVPAGTIPMVATRCEKMLGNQIPEQLHAQAIAFGKPIRLCRYRFVEEVVLLHPAGVVMQDGVILSKGGES